MKLKIILLSVLVALGPQISQAISMGSISDALASNRSTSTPAPAATHPPKAENHLPNPALFIEDAAMTGYIHSQLLLKKNIPNVSVTTENAIVSLSGTVDTQEQADTLVKTASSVKGVKFVNTDHLVIRKKS